MRKFILLAIAGSLAYSVNAQISESEKNDLFKLLDKNKFATGLSDADVTNSVITHGYLIPETNIRMAYLQQTYKGIPVYNQINVLAFREDELVSKSGSRISDLNSRVPITEAYFPIDHRMALKAALVECKISPAINTEPLSLNPGAPKYKYGKLGVSSEDISVELIWLPLNEGKNIRLAWQVFIVPLKSTDYWLIRVDALSGEIIGKQSLTDYCNWDKTENNSNEPSPSCMSAHPVNQDENPFIVNNSNYRVIAYPAESPSHPGGAHTIRTNPWTMAPGNATSLGWHYDGTTHYSNSRGNNVYAYEDRNNDNLPGASAISTSGQPDLNFDFVPDYSVEPTVTSPTPNQQFNITNLFYWNNIIHDIAYIYGFTESARNFQNNNQGRGGAQLDYVQAEAQDGGGSNNANFATPPDGSRPRMQMFLWTSPTPDRDGDVDNGIIIHEYTHGISNRLTGSGSGCLSNGEQMGEGWSDYFSLMLTHDWSTATIGDGFSNPRGIGTYALNQPTTGPGIRQYRYTTDMNVNPLTYGNLPTVAHPHGTGTIWCTVLWDMTWDIIQTAGINPSLHNIGAGGGNAIALKLVLEGMRLQPCSPGFIDGRNAILKADTIFFGAQYSCAIINVFARRGMGIGASQGSSNLRTDQTLSYAGCVPGACNAPVSLSSSSITTNSATISWASAGGAVSYDVDYKSNSSGTWINLATATTSTSLGLTGLTSSTLYDWRVRSNCASTSSGYASAQFTTSNPPCNQPTGLTSSSITTSGATLDWSAITSAVSYTVDYKFNSSTTWINAGTGIASTSVSLTGLSPASIYDWRVRSNCETISSSFVHAQFTTATPPNTCPSIYDVSTNGTTTGAALIPLNTEINGLVNPSGDNDYYKFSITNAGSITINLTMLPANYDLRLYNSAGTRLAESKRNGTNNETISRTLVAGDYYALVSPKGGANHPTSCYNLKVVTVTASLGTEITMENGVQVFPNPVTNILSVRIPELNGVANIKVFDMLGRLLLQQQTRQMITDLNLSHLLAGTYYVRILHNGNEAGIKAIKQ